MSGPNGSNGHGGYDAGIEAELRPPKPCCKPITHENVSPFEARITWCTEPDGHDGQCSGPLPSILVSDRVTRRR